MAVPPIDIPVQDMPPRGGYPRVNVARSTPSRGPPGWVMWIGFIGFVSYGFVGLIDGNKRRNAMQREKREARLNIQPYLLAEMDVLKVKYKQKQLEDEELVMGHLPGWKIGEDVYKSGIYMPPTVNKGWPNDLMM